MVQGKYRLSLFKRHNSERPKLTFAFRQLMFQLCSACHPDPYSATMFMVCRSSIFHIAVLKVFYLSHMVRKCLGCGCSGQRLESCTSKAAPEKFLECSIKCVCVEHLKRCKTSNSLVQFFENFVLIFVIKLSQQGDGEDIWGSIQRSSSYDPRISPGTPGDVPATPFYFLVHGNRLSQVPACRFSNFFRTKPLYGFRNLIYCWLRQMEQLHLART